MEGGEKLREGLEKIERMKEVKCVKEVGDVLDEVGCVSEE